MKKAAGLLILLMVLSLFTGALAAPGGANVFYRITQDDPTVYLQQVVTDGKNLYAFRSTAMDDMQFEFVHYDYQTQAVETLKDYVFSPFISTKAEFEKEGKGDIDRLINRLVLSDGELFGLNFATGTVSRLTHEAGAVTFTSVGTFDTAPLLIEMSDYAYAKEIYSVLKQGDGLYITTYDYDSSPCAALLRFDLKTGAYKTLSNVAARELIPYKEGSALALIYDPQNSYDAQTNTWSPREVHSVNLQTGASAKLYTLDAASHGIAYNAETDSLYYTQGSQVMAIKAGGVAEKVAYVPATGEMYDTRGAAYANGLYTVADAYGAAVRNIDPQYLPTKVLTIYGGYPREMDIAYINACPDVALNYTDQYFGSVELLAQALAASSDIDIVCMDIKGMKTLIDKGYCADLSVNSELMADAAKLYPYLSDYLSRDGKLYALPYTAYQSTWAYMTDVLYDMELEEKDLPTTYEALFQFITLWNDEMSYDFPEYAPFSPAGSLRETLLYDMIDSYAMYYQSIGEELTFSTPVFESLIKAFEEMKTDRLVRESMTEEEMWSMRGLFQVGHTPVEFPSINPNDPKTEYVVQWPIKVTDDAPILYASKCRVMFINPNSKHKDEAAAYLLSQFQGLDFYVRPELDAAMEPVENPAFQAMQKTFQKDYDYVKNLMETVDESEVRGLEPQLTYLEEMINNPELYRYHVTPQALAYYKEHVVDHCIVYEGNPIDSTDGQALAPVVQRFLDKQLTGDQFINELEKKMRMIIQERK